MKEVSNNARRIAVWIASMGGVEAQGVSLGACQVAVKGKWSKNLFYAVKGNLDKYLPTVEGALAAGRQTVTFEKAKPQDDKDFERTQIVQAATTGVCPCCGASVSVRIECDA